MKHEPLLKLTAAGSIAPPRWVGCSCGWKPTAGTTANNFEEQLAMHIAQHREKPSLLNRDDLAPEQASGIEAMEPRPGYIFVAQVHDEITYELLDQATTDAQIVRELRERHVPGDELVEFDALTSAFRGPKVRIHTYGGVHSDPFVRVLAWRAWGRRDLDWALPTYPERDARATEAIAKAARSTVNAPFREPTRRQPASEPRAALHSVGCDDPTCDGQRCAR